MCSGSCSQLELGYKTRVNFVDRKILDTYSSETIYATHYISRGRVDYREVGRKAHSLDLDRFDLGLLLSNSMKSYESIHIPDNEIKILDIAVPEKCPGLAIRQNCFFVDSLSMWLKSTGKTGTIMIPVVYLTVERQKELGAGNAAHTVHDSGKDLCFWRPGIQVYIFDNSELIYNNYYYYLDTLTINRNIEFEPDLTQQVVDSLFYYALKDYNERRK